MSTWLRVLLLLAAGSQCINAYCNETAVKSIKNFWGKKPTHVYLQKLVGTLTYVWISPSILGGQNLTCFQTTVATDEMSVKDYMVDVDGSTSTSIDYFYLLERPGYITLTSPGSPDDWAHVVYFNSKRHVMAYYQCSPTGDSYEPFVAVVAVNYKKNSLAIARAIRAAIAVLDKLGINTGSSIRTDCSTFVRNSTIIK
ncbi:uncharacterized protein LOC124366563 [Homalodisca vitripennis]|uniref:uncharacterized protein LOC124366563 n=1 Tax=Homalodisca vitripennis TaxID=197043 RepID=UPI001EEB1AD8|nr:uncharacterized protein LOC124366563 [Homalodisca vitripennis]XP_046679114.1 uncharacterized protein LOC124366563 [Homalodisca vitripennis]